MSTNVIQGSFASGEIAPSLYARVDLAKYRTGAALIRNMIVDYRGGVVSRPGSEYILRARDSSHPVRLIPFQFKTEQEYELEFGHFYMRVIKDGGFVLEPAFAITSVTKANPGVVSAPGHDFVNGDWVFISGIVGMTGLNSDTYIVAGAASGTFTLTDLDGNAIDTSAFAAYISGGTVARVFTLTTPYDSADLALLKYTQSADVMTLTHPSYMPRDLNRIQHWNWTLTDINFGSSIAAPAHAWASASKTGVANYGYQVTAVSESGDESYASQTAYITNAVDITATAGSTIVSWTPVPNAFFYNIYKIELAASGGTVDFPPADVPVPIGSAYGYTGSSRGLQFIDNNITPDYTKTAPIHTDPFAPGQITAVTATAIGSGYTDNPTVSITDPTGSGASVLPILYSGGIQGFYILNGGSGYTAPTVTIAGGGGTGATATATVGPSIGTYPGVCCYFQQRRVFAASINNPDTVWATQPGTFSNMDISNPVRDDNALTLALASQQVNNIRDMIPMPSGLVLLTSGGAWQLSGGAQSAALTPSNAVAQPQAYNGCSDIPALVINYDILYVQAKGSVIRDLAYNYYVNIYTGTDISVLAAHLLTNYTLFEWCYAEEPYKCIQIVRDDGQLINFTYLKEQDVYAFAHSDTLGIYESISTIVENGENAVYQVVSRLIKGNWVKCVERQASRLMPNGIEDAWCVDCGLSNTPVYPAAALTLAAASGSGVTATASAAVFAVGDVGKVIRAGGGTATIVTFTDSTHVIVNFTRPVKRVLPNGTPLPIAAGTWTCDATFTVFDGLGHLEGQMVSILADGGVLPPQTVINGSVTLDHPVSKIVVGLPFTAQLQTLRLDAGEPTIQGKRKKIPAVTIRYQDSRGIKVGHDFDTLWELKSEPPVDWGVPTELESGDAYQPLDPLWDTEGQLCLQQDNPLPMTILGVIPEVLVGDDSRG